MVGRRECTTILTTTAMVVSSCAIDLGPRRSLEPSDPSGGGTGGGGGGGGGQQVGGGNFVECEPSSRVQWIRMFGDAALAEPRDATADGEGGIYIAGELTGSIDFGGGELVSAGDRDLFLARLDTNGAHVWAKRFGTPKDDLYDGDITVVEPALDGGVYLVAQVPKPMDLGDGIPNRFDGPASHVSHFGPDGAHRWTTWLPNAATRDAALHSRSNDLVVVGLFQDTAELDGTPVESNGAQDAFVVVLDAESGRLKRHRTLGGPDDDVLHGVVDVPNGDIVVGGHTDNELDFGGGAEPIVGDRDMWLARLDENLEVVWSRTYPGPGFTQSVRRLAFESGGDLLATAELEGSVDMGSGMVSTDDGAVVARIDPSTGIASHALALHGLSQNQDFYAASDGAVVLASIYTDLADLGGTVKIAYGEPDGIVARLSPAFELRWQLALTSPLRSGFKGVVPDLEGHVMVAGFLRDSSDLAGCPTISSNGDSDVVIMKLRP